MDPAELAIAAPVKVGELLAVGPTGVAVGDTSAPEEPLAAPVESVPLDEGTGEPVDPLPPLFKGAGYVVVYEEEVEVECVVLQTVVTIVV